MIGFTHYLPTKLLFGEGQPAKVFSKLFFKKGGNAIGRQARMESG